MAGKGDGGSRHVASYHIEMTVTAAAAPATAAGARDATRLEPLVCFFFLSLSSFFNYTNVCF